MVLEVFAPAKRHVDWKVDDEITLLVVLYQLHCVVEDFVSLREVELSVRRDDSIAVQRRRPV